MKKQLIFYIALAANAGAQNSYVVQNLVSDLPGLAAQTDANLKNPWGLSTSSSSPFWISNNHTGITSVYTGDGRSFPDGKPLVVTIATPPSAGLNTTSSPTGQVFNDTGGFELEPGKPAQFLFVTEDGTLAAWNSAVDPANARIVVDNSAGGAVYKGIAVARTAAGPRIYAANFHAGTVDAFDTKFNPVDIPAGLRASPIPGYAPFNIQRLGQRLYVTYAKQDEDAVDDQPGPGNGYLCVFTLDGQPLGRLVEGGALNSPWGLAIAPDTFGSFSNSLLVANFGDGRINAYDPCSGQWLGSLAGVNGQALAIPGLWALRPGNGHNGGEAGVLYFTAGIPGDDDLESHGLFGSITPAPPALPVSSSVDIKNLRFNPDAIHIAAGTVLNWTNSDGFAHTVKGDDEPFESGLLNQQGTYTRTFDRPGTYHYHCTIHPFMKGEVVVQ